MVGRHFSYCGMITRYSTKGGIEWSHYSLLRTILCSKVILGLRISLWFLRIQSHFLMDSMVVFLDFDLLISVYSCDYTGSKILIYSLDYVGLCLLLFTIVCLSFGVVF